MLLMLMAYSVAKDSSSPLVLKLTLHSLISCWQPNMTFITDDHRADDETEVCAKLHSRPSITRLIGADSELVPCTVY